MLINQVKAIEWGLSLEQAALFAFLYEMPSHAEETLIDGKCYCCITERYFQDNTSLYGDPSAVKQHLKHLINAGLIDMEHGEKSRIYIRTTEKGRLWNRSAN